MKNYQPVESRGRKAPWGPRPFTGSRVESRKSEARRSAGPRPSTLDPRPGFTLIELLVVIAIMGILAALILPVVGAVKKHQYLYNTQAEMAKLETAIDRYKAVYGFYPPSNQQSPANPMVNQLYYELTGTTNLDVNNPNYQSLDGAPPTLTGVNVTKAFGVGGFMNCSKSAGGEDASAARNFLPDLKPNQVWNYTNAPATEGVKLLLCSVGGPDANSKPLGSPDVNPWRYNSSNPTNNPGSYELWIQLVIGKQTNLICNWTKQVQINSPLP
jgi:prepilin-type N-terminal cleavage/methylation domain-containing protein